MENLSTHDESLAANASIERYLSRSSNVKPTVIRVKRKREDSSLDILHVKDRPIKRVHVEGGLMDALSKWDISDKPKINDSKDGVQNDVKTPIFDKDHSKSTITSSTGFIFKKLDSMSSSIAATADGKLRLAKKIHDSRLNIATARRDTVSSMYNSSEYISMENRRKVKMQLKNKQEKKRKDRLLQKRHLNPSIPTSKVSSSSNKLGIDLPEALPTEVESLFRLVDIDLKQPKSSETTPLNEKSVDVSKDIPSSSIDLATDGSMMTSNGVPMKRMHAKSTHVLTPMQKDMDRAIWSMFHEGECDDIFRLIGFGEDVNFQRILADGTTALQGAAFQLRGDIVDELIKLGAKASIKDNNGYNALDWMNKGLEHASKANQKHNPCRRQGRGGWDMVGPPRLQVV